MSSAQWELLPWSNFFLLLCLRFLLSPSSHHPVSFCPLGTVEDSGGSRNPGLPQPYRPCLTWSWGPWSSPRGYWKESWEHSMKLVFTGGAAERALSEGLVGGLGGWVYTQEVGWVVGRARKQLCCSREQGECERK